MKKTLKLLVYIMELTLCFVFSEKFGLPNVMFLYAAMSFVLLVFVILCIPETKGRTLEEISKELAKKWVSSLPAASVCLSLLPWTLSDWCHYLLLTTFASSENISTWVSVSGRSFGTAWFAAARPQRRQRTSETLTTTTSLHSFTL